jgi:hypothetical protein
MNSRVQATKGGYFVLYVWRYLLSLSANQSWKVDRLVSCIYMYMRVCVNICMYVFMYVCMYIVVYR